MVGVVFLCVTYIRINGFHHMSFMIYCERIAVQGEVVVKAHILDTALMFLGFCKTKRGRALLAQAAADIDAAAADGASTEETGDSAEAAVQNLLGQGAKKLEEAFAPGMTGQVEHRLKDASVILRVAEPQVIHFLASWRKKSHSCHANALAQQWFLTAE